jgi:hypothetical protein
VCRAGVRAREKGDDESAEDSRALEVWRVSGASDDLDMRPGDPGHDGGCPLAAEGVELAGDDEGRGEDVGQPAGEGRHDALAGAAKGIRESAGTVAEPLPPEAAPHPLG